MKPIMYFSDEIEVFGKVSYHEAARAFNTIRIPKIMLHQFPELRSRLIKVDFFLKFYRSYNELNEFLKKLESKKEQMPILLFLYKHE